MGHLRVALFSGALSRPMSAKSPDPLQVISLDLEGQGVARRDDGKVVFIEGALPFETVTAQLHRQKAQWEQGTVEQVLRQSPFRTTPRCPHFGLHRGACGGCKVQHLRPEAQVAVKQRVLEDNLWHLAKVRPEQILRPLQGPDWGYRHRARLAVRHVHRKSQVLVGFHERKSRYVADMERCEVLAPRVSRLLPKLRQLVAQLDSRDRIPQIEVALGDEVLALVLRHLVPLSAHDQDCLRSFAQTYHVQWWLQPQGPDSVHLLEAHPDHMDLSYALPEFSVRMPFRPTDFTQVNPHINRSLISQALLWLNAQAQDQVIDWFCGLGNFTLPIARQARQVLGIEGSTALVERARANASLNGLSAQTSFEERNLFEIDARALAELPAARLWLIDPPREGALALCKALCDVIGSSPDPASVPPRRVVYISCNPATLARDAGLLVHQAGYRLVAAGIVNMFPHTAHVESMAVFEK